MNQAIQELTAKCSFVPDTPLGWDFFTALKSPTEGTYTEGVNAEQLDDELQRYSLSSLRLAQSICNNPRPIYFNHRYKDLQVKFYAPCRNCDQCKNNQANELVGRVFQDICILKNAYFITLTYPSFEHSYDIPQPLKNCFYHYDNHYFKASPSGRNLPDNVKPKVWSPCLLYYPHVQSFQKNLRISLNRLHSTNVYTEIITTGELGHSYGRPHWHIIIISSHVIPQTLINETWTKTIQAPARVDYEDLKANGTIAARNVQSSPNKRNVKKCVKYLVKYCKKTAKFNTIRIGYAQAYFRTHDFLPSGFINYPNSIYTQNEYHFTKAQSYLKAKDKSSTFDLSLQDIAQLFGTAHQQSSTNSIGKLYAIANLQRFSTGNKKLTPVPLSMQTAPADGFALSKSADPQDWTPPFPAYYSLLTQRYKNPLQLRRKTAANSITSTIPSLHHLPTLLDFFHTYYDFFRYGSRSSIARSSLVRPATLEDLQFLAHCPSSVQNLLFPDSNPEYIAEHQDHEINHIKRVYLYDWRNKANLDLYVATVNGQPVELFIGSSRYNRKTRSFSRPLPVSPFRLYAFLVYQLESNRRDYNQSASALAFSSSFLDYWLNSPHGKDALLKNWQNWRELHHDLDEQTKNNNPYD